MLTIGRYADRYAPLSPGCIAAAFNDHFKNGWSIGARDYHNRAKTSLGVTRSSLKRGKIRK
jgi:hypothetical protein